MYKHLEGVIFCLFAKSSNVVNYMTFLQIYCENIFPLFYIKLNKAFNQFMIRLYVKR